MGRPRAAAVAALLVTLPAQLRGDILPVGLECGPAPSFHEGVALSRAVFSGRVASLTDPAGRPDARVATLQVLESWKGDPPPQVEVWTLKGGEGFAFEAGGEYLVSVALSPDSVTRRLGAMPLPTRAPRPAPSPSCGRSPG